MSKCEFNNEYSIFSIRKQHISLLMSTESDLICFLTALVSNDVKQVKLIEVVSQ